MLINFLLLSVSIGFFSIRGMQEEPLEARLIESQDPEMQKFIKWAGKEDTICALCNKKGTDLPWLSDSGAHEKCIMYVVDTHIAVMTLIGSNFSFLKTQKYHEILTRGVTSFLEQEHKSRFLKEYTSDELSLLFKVQGVRALEKHCQAKLAKIKEKKDSKKYSIYTVRQKKDKTKDLLETLTEIRKEAESQEKKIQ